MRASNARHCRGGDGATDNGNGFRCASTVTDCRLRPRPRKARVSWFCRQDSYRAEEIDVSVKSKGELPATASGVKANCPCGNSRTTASVQHPHGRRGNNGFLRTLDTGLPEIYVSVGASNRHKKPAGGDPAGLGRVGRSRARSRPERGLNTVSCGHRPDILFSGLTP